MLSNRYMNQKNPGFHLLTFLTLITLCACEDDFDLQKVVFESDFESGTLSPEVSAGPLSFYNGTHVIGPFNKSGFSVTIDHLEAHEYVQLSFDLYISGTWDGNLDTVISLGEKVVAGPDFWTLEIEQSPEPELRLAKELYFKTTFANGHCLPDGCKIQSYPEQYPFIFNPWAGSTQRALPDPCTGEASLSSVYRIQKVYPHRSGTLRVSFYDNLQDSKERNALCNESWSMDNLTIKILK